MIPGDTCETIAIPKPTNIIDPPRNSKVESSDSVGDFDERAASFAKTARRIRLTRNSAQKLQSVINEALGDIKSEFSSGNK